MRPRLKRDPPSMSPTEARPPLRVALVQFKPTKADVARNIQAVRDIVGAHANQTDLVVFPEAALSGYFLEGGVAEAALTVERLIEMLGPPPATGPDVVIGFYERWRRSLHNSAVYLEAGDGAWAVRHVHRKMFLPTYGVFDEARFVEAASIASTTWLTPFHSRISRVPGATAGAPLVLASLRAASSPVAMRSRRRRVGVTPP